MEKLKSLVVEMESIEEKINCEIVE